MPIKDPPMYQPTKTDRIMDVAWLPLVLALCAALAFVVCAVSRL